MKYGDQGGFKRKLPEPFDGKREELQGFLTSVRAYLRAKNIQDPAQEVEFAGTLLKGDALSWFEPYLRDYLENTPEDRTADTDKFFENFDNFASAIKNTFGDVDETRTAERQLLNIRQTGSASKYASRFQQISAHLG